MPHSVSKQMLYNPESLFMDTAMYTFHIQSRKLKLLKDLNSIFISSVKNLI